MHSANISLKRMIWLLYNELRIKKINYVLILFTAFGALIYLFFNPTFSFTGIMDSLLVTGLPFQSTGQVTFNGSRVFTGGFPKFHLDFLPKALILISSIFTSLAFSEYSADKSSRFYLSLPATNLEKWLVKVVWYVLIFPLVFYVMYYLYMLLTHGWGDDLGRNTLRLPFFDPYIWNFIMLNFFIQLLVFAGAATFKKYSAIKLTLFGFGFFYFLTFLRNILVSNLVTVENTSFSSGSIFSPTWWWSYLSKSGLRVKNITHEMPWLFDGIGMSVFITFILALLLSLSFTKFKELEA